MRSDPCALPILEGFPEPVFLLNEHRQIVVANKAAAMLSAALAGTEAAEGLRLGEALACVNVANGPDGCGTGPQCPHCGAGRANRAFGIKPGEYGGEFRLRTARGGVESAQTFNVHLSPVRLNGSTLRLCTLTDITAEKSREVLDNIFFHDVLNTAQAVQGAAVLMPGLEDAEELDHLAHIVSTSAAVLVSEIQSQRDLLRAEDGELTLSLEPVSVSALVTETAELYRQSRFGAGRHIDVVPAPPNDEVVTSRVHLSRCVGNLVKNALEASRPGDHVTVRVTGATDAVVIDVHNPAVMTEAVQAQVFQRFFSTKGGSGRGLGTYSVRLLVTRYLGGTVTFVSNEGGTTFTIRLPRGTVR